MSSTLPLTEDLLRRPSVSPEDHGCLDVIGARLAALGFRNERLTYAPVDNLWSRRGSAQPVLCFAGHTDVVPTGPREEWRTDPFEPVVRDGMLLAACGAGETIALEEVQGAGGRRMAGALYANGRPDIAEHRFGS